MLFMNTWEVDEAVARHAPQTVKGAAARLLAKVRDWADSNSDGWAHYPAPCRACRQMIELIEEKDPGKVTPVRFKKAAAAVKALFTRLKRPFPFEKEATCPSPTASAAAR